MGLIRAREITLNAALALSAVVLLCSAYIYPGQQFSARKETVLAIAAVLVPAFLFELFCCISTRVALVKGIEIEQAARPVPFTIICTANSAFILFLVGVAIYAA